MFSFLQSPTGKQTVKDGSLIALLFCLLRQSTTLKAVGNLQYTGRLYPHRYGQQGGQTEYFAKKADFSSTFSAFCPGLKTSRASSRRDGYPPP
ncbi:MAG: hypothetical protein PHQ75_01395 [Thermoguttaceae bacterium]|nr:hypothetical protein [Thermoguttaceae bacterium]